MSLNQYTADSALERVLKNEGGYVNNKDDLGGETNFGITKATALENKSLWSQYGWDGNMRTMPLAFAKAVYRQRYWDKVQGDRLHDIHPLLADHLFDFAVNAGTGNAVKHLQRALNVLNRKQVDYADVGVDGALGQGTFRSLEAYVRKRGQTGIENLIMALVAMQWGHYLAIAEAREANETFANGWLERAINKMVTYAREM
jgi:hypothetical protein